MVMNYQQGQKRESKYTGNQDSYALGSSRSYSALQSSLGGCPHCGCSGNCKAPKYMQLLSYRGNEGAKREYTRNTPQSVPHGKKYSLEGRI